MGQQKLSADILRKHKGVSFPGITTLFICHDGTGRIFMTKRSQNARDEHGRWEFGAGGLKWGSTAQDNVRRELKEEYDAEPLAVDFIGYFDVFRSLPDGTPTHWIALCFAALVNPAQIKINEPDIFDDSAWFTLDTIPTPAHSQMDLFLSLHRDNLEKILKTTRVTDKNLVQ